MAERPADLAQLLDVPQEAYEVMLRAALERYGEAKFYEAHTILAGLTVLHPKDPRPYKLLGSIMLLTDRRREAEACFTKAHALEPDDPYVLLALGEIRLHAYHIKEALPLFERLFEIDPENEHPATQRGRYVLSEFRERLAREG